MTDLSKAAQKALTDPRAWASASGKTLAEALPHVWDAFEQVQAGADIAARRAMLSRLPPHVAKMVEGRLLALWGGALVVFATDASPAGRKEAIQQAAERGGAVHVLELEGLAIVTIKNPA